MAVLHHAFRCSVTPEFERTMSKLLATWHAGNRAGLSAMARDNYGTLAKREDLHHAFFLHPEGDVESWLQPEFISPGLAALVMLADTFVAIPGLSTSLDTNHYLLETQLPLLGWSAEEVHLMVRGQPIETVLQACDETTSPVVPGGFRYTGGWTPGSAAPALKARLEHLSQGASSRAGERLARQTLQNNGALSDAQAMLAEIGEKDWLVMAVTH